MAIGRGKGIGSWVELKVLTSNPGVVRMHRRFGFQEEGPLRNDYLPQCRSATPW